MNQKTYSHLHTATGEPGTETQNNKQEASPLSPLRKKIGAAAAALTLLGVVWVGVDSRTESPGQFSQINEHVIEGVSDNPFSRIGIFDDDGEGGISVFVDTVGEEYPELIVTKPGEDEYGNPTEIYDYFSTKENVENAFNISADEEGDKIQKVMGGNPQRWAKVEIKYDTEEGFNYTKAG